MPVDVSVDTHIMKELQLFACRYANKLQGTEAPLIEDSKHSILFEFFPQKWKTSFIKSAAKK